MDEAKLFELAKNGDKQSIEWLVEKYYKLAYSLAVKWTKKQVIDLDDAIGEANIALMNSIVSGKYDSERGKFTSYLCRSVDNQIRGYLLNQRKEWAISYADNTVTYASSFDSEGTDLISAIPDDFDLEETVVSSMMGSKVMDLLYSEQVPEKERSCILLWMQGESYSVIGSKLGISRYWADVLTKRGIERLKDLLREAGDL